MLRHTIVIFLCCFVWQTQCEAQERNIFSSNRPQTNVLSLSQSNDWLMSEHYIHSPISTLNEMQDNHYVNKIDTVVKNGDCECKPSIPLEMLATSVIWGFPTYWIWHTALDYTPPNFEPNVAGLYIIPSQFLLMFILGPIAEWTSGCKASYWHTLWIGLGTSTVTTGYYVWITNYSKATYNPYKFNFGQYLILGVIPSVASAFIYNLFLHPKEKHDQSFMIFPSIGRENQACLNLVGRF